MPSGKAISIELWAEYQALRRQGLSMYAAAQKCGISYHACRDAESGKAPRNYVAADETIGTAIQQVPAYDLLPDEAQAAWTS